MNATHWQTVYTAKSDAELSWFQDSPARSLAEISALTPVPRRIVDAGGGQSALAPALLATPAFADSEVTVLDISAAAIARGRERAGPLATRIRWLVDDVLVAADVGEVDLWHDRACFHFLADPADQARYAALVARAVVAGGHLVLATFAPDGPEKCSGLSVARHDGASLARVFAPAFDLVAESREEHVTPWGKPQRFAWTVLRRNAR